MTSAIKPLQEHFSFRPVEESDLDGVIELVRVENWFTQDRGKLDIICSERLACFYAVVDTSQGDKVVGSGSVCKTRQNEAVLGNVFVRNEYRGQGLGTFLIRHIMALHDDVNVTWFSSADELYLKLGFQLCEQKGLFVEMVADREKVDVYVKETPMEESIEIVSLTEDRTEDLVRYDTQARGYESRHFLSLVTRTSDTTAMAVRRSDKSIVGYVAALVSEATGTLFFNGFYADDDRIAGALLKTALDAFPNLTRCRLYTLHTCCFLGQFGQPVMALTQSRFAVKRKPADIPDEKLYCLSQVDISY